MPTVEPLAALDNRLRRWAVDRADRITDPVEQAQLRGIGDVIDLVRVHTPGGRDNGEPAFIHPLWVANLVVTMIDACERAGCSPQREASTLLKIALCHDLLEDSSLTRPQLRELIGTRAERGVYNMSNKYLDANGQRIRKSEVERWADLKSDPLSLIAKYFDRSHNFMTMLDVDDSDMLRGVVYTPEKQREKLHEVSMHLIPAGDPGRLCINYPVVQHPYILSARDTLIRRAAKVVGRFAELDYLRTPMDWDNADQREKLADSIRLPGQDQVGRHHKAVRVPVDDLTAMLAGLNAEPGPQGMFARLAPRALVRFVDRHLRHASASGSAPAIY